MFDPNGKHLRTVHIAGSSPRLLDLRFHPKTGKLLVIDYKNPKVLTVDPKTGASSVFMTVTGEHPGLDGLTFDAAGNVYVTDAHQGMIWRVGKDGGAATAWVKSPLLKPTRPPPAIGANGLAFNNKQTALFVANTAQDTIIKIPVSGSPLEPGTPEVFVNRAGGGPDGIIIDEHDNLWIACNQSNEIMVLEPTQGRVIAKLGDFGGIDKDGAPIGFLWSNSLVFHGDDVLVTNLSADISAIAVQESADRRWTVGCAGEAPHGVENQEAYTWRSGMTVADCGDVEGGQRHARDRSIDCFNVVRDALGRARLCPHTAIVWTPSTVSVGG